MSSGFQQLFCSCQTDAGVHAQVIFDCLLSLQSANARVIIEPLSQNNEPATERDIAAAIDQGELGTGVRRKVRQPETNQRNRHSRRYNTGRTRTIKPRCAGHGPRSVFKCHLVSDRDREETFHNTWRVTGRKLGRHGRWNVFVGKIDEVSSVDY